MRVSRRSCSALATGSTLQRRSADSSSCRRIDRSIRWSGVGSSTKTREGASRSYGALRWECSRALPRAPPEP